MLKLTFLNLGIFGVILLTLPDIVSAKTPAEVKQIATASTVKIGYYINNNWAEGSGVIHQKQGDVYTIVTNAHVACGDAEGTDCSTNPASYVITTPDFSRHQMIYGSAKRISNNLDLATIKFRSSKVYTLAQFADSSKTTNQEIIYTAGFPRNQSKLNFSNGKLIANVKNRMVNDKGGYTTLYDSFTLPGMSGSGVFNSQGQIIAIHGQGDRFNKGSDINDSYRFSDGSSEPGEKIGINRGIPVNRLNSSFNSSVIFLDDNKNKPSTADELIIFSYNTSLNPDPNKKIEIEKRKALKQVSQAIKIQPNYLHSYILRGWIYSQLKDNRLALADFDRAVSLDPEYDTSYSLRAITKFVMGNRRGSLDDYNKAISINPENFIALENRGITKQSLDDHKGALDDFNRASKINPASKESNRIAVLIGKCGANGALGNIKEALQNCNKAIEVHGIRGGDPRKLAAVYSNLGTAKFRSGDKQGALADLNKSISLNSSDPNPYINRGSLKYALNDKPGALADFNQALSLKSTNVNIYLGIAIIKEESGELQESLSYYKKAEEIYSQKGDFLNKSLVFYNISKLQQKINPNQSLIDSQNAAPASQANSPDEWLQRTINQGLSDLLGMPRK
jgi:tetratricopeptide (TPR) repeat protein